MPEMVTNQRKGRWEQLFNTAVVGKTLLIVGVGSVGGSVARLAKLWAFDAPAGRAAMSIRCLAPTTCVRFCRMPISFWLRHPRPTRPGIF